MKGKISVAITSALVLWFIMFSPLTKDFVSFWGMMSLSAILLTGLSFSYGRDIWYARLKSWRTKPFSFWIEQVFIGLFLAALLWAVFWCGDKVSKWLFSFAGKQIDGVYAIKEGFNPNLIGILLLCLIGPAEELFWRGYIQESLQHLFSNQFTKPWLGTLIGALISTVIYTVIHIPSFNFMLIVAALVCGIIWGGLYWWKTQWLPALIISHAVWDAAVFIYFPV